MTFKDKYTGGIMFGNLAFIKLDYCYGTSYSLLIGKIIILIQDCHKLCSTCLGPESN